MQNSCSPRPLILFSLFLFLCSCSAMLEASDSNSSAPSNSQPSRLAYGNFVYEPFIKTIQVFPQEAPLAPPYLELNTQNPLEVHFDDLSGGFQDYRYRVIHCTADWSPSDLDYTEYIRGFETMQIDDVESSFNTKVQYTHYQFTFPNDMMIPTLSGNYLIEVFPYDAPNKPLFSRRIVVYEQLVRFRTEVKAPTVISERRYKQEIDFDVVMFDYTIDRPYQDLDIALLQNHRWDNAIMDLKPVFVKGNELIYDHDTENNFDGGNEYRFLDLKDLRFLPINADSLREAKSAWQLYLQADQKRSFDTYRTVQDINGKFLIKNDLFDDQLESDYVNVHFQLNYPLDLVDGGVYLLGEFNAYERNEASKMTYNRATKCFEIHLLLKQGYYNYIYLSKFDRDPEADIKLIEGSHQETENEYTVIAYNYDPSGYDRVVGILFTDSFNR